MRALFFGPRNTSTRQDVALLLGRVALGAVLIAHGWQKLFSYGISGAAESFEKMGVPLPTLSASFAGTVELLGGILLIIGLIVPLVGVLVAIDMLGALIFVHAPNGMFATDGGYELVLLIGALGLMFAGLGAGRFAVDGLIPTSHRAGVKA